MNTARLQLIVRTILGLLAAGSVPALEVAGYQDGAATTMGVDGGTVRYLVSAFIALAAVFYPQITTVWASITNNPRLDALEKRVDALDGKPKAAKTAVPTATKTAESEA